MSFSKFFINILITSSLLVPVVATTKLVLDSKKLEPEISLEISDIEIQIEEQFIIPSKPKPEKQPRSQKLSNSASSSEGVGIVSGGTRTESSSSNVLEEKGLTTNQVDSVSNNSIITKEPVPPDPKESTPVTSEKPQEIEDSSSEDSEVREEEDQHEEAGKSEDLSDNEISDTSGPENTSEQENQSKVEDHQTRILHDSLNSDLLGDVLNELSTATIVSE